MKSKEIATRVGHSRRAVTHEEDAQGEHQHLHPVFFIVSDPDPCGSVLKWLPWIRIRIRIWNTDPDPGRSKWCQKRKKILRFQVKRAFTIFLKA